MFGNAPFLTAKWENLVVVNYEVDPRVLKPLVPAGTEVDTFNGKAFISVVAFNFRDTKFLGAIPTYPSVNFEEINLRFYVKRSDGGAVKRGVTFVKEIVPSRAIAWTARAIYNEPYVTERTFHDDTKFHPVDGGEIRYGFTRGPERFEISAKTTGSLKELTAGSVEEFILEHYWGYTKQPRGTSEYQVTHPRWRYWEAGSCAVSENIASLYGESFSPALRQKAHSVFVAEGSKIAVLKGERIPEKSPRGWVLYDGACGFCSWWIPHWRGAIQKAGYDIAPLQAPWVKERLKIPPEKLTSDIRLLLNDGSLVNGADAYIYGMKQVWWSRPLGYLLGLPGLRWATWQAYKVFNRNRFFVSRMCRLPAEVTAPPSGKPE